MKHLAFTSGSVAVVTGGASGIGLASAMQFASMELNIVIVDLEEDKLASAEKKLCEVAKAEVVTVSADISDPNQLETLEKQVFEQFGGTDILMNNAGIGGSSSCLEPSDAWRSMLDVNLWGAIHGTQVFAPRMIARERPGAIVNTGSKQGITTPPGNPAYNVSKAALKTFTEALAHELRNLEGSKITAHLLIPGFVYTGMIKSAKKPMSAWTSEQTAKFFIESMNKGDFYILCPDNSVTRELDEKRIAWSAGDIIENRPALSRWHPDYSDAFNLFVNSKN